MNEEITAEPAYTEPLGRISEAYVAGQPRATQAVNTHITELLVNRPGYRGV
jgi:hypothetical protein